MPEVGQAILNYLRQGRPQTSLREFFVKATAPAGAFANGSSLYTIFSRRIRRAGLKPEGKRGPHAIRYARAMSLLRANIPLKSIGDVLGHRSAASTQLYLKLATEDLRSVALAVPGGGCMRKTWPDREQALLRRYVAELELNQESPRAGKPYESVLRRFQMFVMERSTKGSPDRIMIEAWLRGCLQRSTLRLTIRRAQIVSGFLDWLVRDGFLTANPFAEICSTSRRRSTAAIVHALVSPDPDSALQRLRGLPRLGSHLGPILQAHVEHMKTLGLRYQENRFRHCDEFLQRRPGAARESLATVVQEYVTLAPSPAAQMERVKVGRVVARYLQRTDPTVMLVKRDRMVAREALRRRKNPCIFTKEQIQHLFQTAREYPSPKAPLRPLSLYTMFVLAYCAGLRMAEIVGLHLGHIREANDTIDIRDTKFFKSRRLPLSPSAMAVIHRYLLARHQAHAPTDAESPLFWHQHGGYAYVTANHLMRRVMRSAGLKLDSGRAGPRVHDLRHSFVVHRMIEWYEEGVDVQAKLPYLWTYLGHRDLHSSLHYITITQELLQRASERFRAFSAQAVRLREET